MRGQIETGLRLREVADGGHLLRLLAHVRLLLLRVLLDLQLEVHRPLILVAAGVFRDNRVQLRVVVARGPRGTRVGGGVETPAGGHAGLGAAGRGRGRGVLVVELLSSFEDGTLVKLFFSIKTLPISGSRAICNVIRAIVMQHSSSKYIGTTYVVFGTERRHFELWTTFGNFEEVT